MNVPDASVLALYGIGFTLAFGAWKMTVAPRLARRAYVASG